MEKPCPDWIAKYAEYHNAARYLPTSKYLIYLCSNGQAEDTADFDHRQNCNGLADRMKGLMFLTRLAAGTGRILIINMTNPAPLSDALMPTLFDWRVSNLSVPCNDMKFPCHSIDAFGRLISATFITTFGGYGGLPHDLTDSSFLTNPTTHFYVTTVHYPNYDLPEWFPAFPNEPAQGSHFHCLFSALFQASPQVDAIVQSHVERIWSQRPIPEYLALHLRMSIDHVSMSHEFVEAAFAGATALAAENNISTIFLATDSSHVREKVLRGARRGFVTFDMLPQNVDVMGSHANRHEQFMKTVAEFVMLSRSKCLIMSRSGFSEAAQYLGGQDCWSTVQKCAEIAGVGH